MSPSPWVHHTMPLTITPLTNHLVVGRLQNGQLCMLSNKSIHGIILERIEWAIISLHTTMEDLKYIHN